MLERQQMARHIGLASPVRPCCLVSHEILDSHESQVSILYCDPLGETAPCVCRILTSQIFVIFQGGPTVYGSHLWLSQG